MKRILAVFLTAALLLGACSASPGSSDETETTAAVATEAQTVSSEASDGSELVGQITAIDGSAVTLALGTVSDMPSGEMPSGDGQTPSGDGTVPEKPDGEGGDMPSGGGQAPSGEDGSVPEKPDGEGGDMPSGDGQAPSGEDGSVPEKPDGEGGDMPSGDGQAPSGDGGMGGGMGGFTASGEEQTVDLSGATITRDGETITVSDLAVGDILTVTMDGETAVSAAVQSMTGGMGGQGGGFGGSSEVTQGSAATNLDTDGTYTGETYTSTGDDENALRVTGATVTLDGVTVDKSAGATSNTENGDFYGVNAALLATDGAQVTITNATVTSSAQNGNGVFSYGEGTVVTISDSTITTTADNSGGIQTTGGGTTIATNLTVETSGSSAAAIRSDRGGGTVFVTEGTYVSNGYNSPAVYSTADITVSDATLTANNSEALVIEGANSIVLENCTVSGNMSDTNGTSSDENVHNIMIYQSMSGDAAVGTSTFTAAGGSITCRNGDMIFVTNTNCVLTLSGVTLVNEDEDGALLRVTGNSASHGWGTAGANGATVTMTCDAQTLEGDIIVDAISSLDLTLSNGSTLSGTVNIVDNAEGGTDDSAAVNITVDAGCTWTLTGDCTVTTLTNNGTINYNGYTITLADGTVMQ